VRCRQSALSCNVGVARDTLTCPLPEGEGSRRGGRESGEAPSPLKAHPTLPSTLAKSCASTPRRAPPTIIQAMIWMIPPAASRRHHECRPSARRRGSCTRSRCVFSQPFSLISLCCRSSPPRPWQMRTAKWLFTHARRRRFGRWFDVVHRHQVVRSPPKKRSISPRRSSPPCWPPLLLRERVRARRGSAIAIGALRRSNVVVSSHPAHVGPFSDVKHEDMLASAADGAMGSIHPSNSCPQRIAG